ncbi:MAG: beta-phosphoglucomutase family hydrolase [Bacteroidales bacterium]|nr:beta-phosphoglucomutase family hydrolase [Bacteroidales bacterium]MDD3859514.1 beta-phosphoglucomutase family hydrolase [Bacteroidales bacterium]
MIANFDAVIFDLDGVITDTASIHCIAWKQTFDGVLKHHSKINNTKYISFDIEKDYFEYVDGKPRYDGVLSFLNSRGIEFPYGEISDSGDMFTICGIGNRKNQIFNDLLQSKGAEVFESTVTLIKQLIENDIKLAVASSSRNCMPILKKANLDKLFMVCVDGLVSEEKKLKGKPAPDIFRTACDLLSVPYHRAVIVEDAVSGVTAGKAGNFGLVIGVARHNNQIELKINGADITVTDLEEINFETISTWFEVGLKEDLWSLKYSDFIPENERSRESLLTVGNGFFASRGCFCEEKTSNNHYPGTYMAGVYNKLPSVIQGKTVYNEDLVNCPNWLFTSFKIDDDDWINSESFRIIDIERTLDLKKGILSGWALVEDKKGRQTMIESVRCVSMFDKNLAGIEYSVTPLNYSGKISIKTGLDADIINDGVSRYRDLNQKHLTKADTSFKDNIIRLNTKTVQSDINISVAAIVYSNLLEASSTIRQLNSAIEIEFKADVSENHEFVIYKNVAYTNSLDKNKFDLDEKLQKNNHFSDLVNKSALEWAKIWKKVDIEIDGDRLSQKLVRLHIYHLLVSASENSIDADVSIGARGLHGEAYRGHIFWDELYIFPFYNIHFPEVTKSMLMYRYNRLDAARKYAKLYGYAGAMFPWQSSSTGDEETQEIHLNPKSGLWGDDYSRNQRHVSLAIGLNIIRYYQATNDKEFLKNFGFEILTEICRFFVSACIYSARDFRYHTENMMGPDEFHEKYPNSDKGGLKDNAYTNVMLAWLLQQTISIFYKQNELIANSGFVPNKCEIDKWTDVSENLSIKFNEEGIIEQFDGYFNLKELDWVAYKKKYGDIYRLDRILKSEGLNPDDYKLSKQADTLMIFYNLTDKEINETISGLGYELPIDYKIKNFYYYVSRTSHGSSLSRVVHAYLAHKWDLKDVAENIFHEALISDYSDIQGGTTSEGIHAGVMAATVMHILNSYAGLDFRDKVLSVSPDLPDLWHRCRFNFMFRNIHYKMIINHDSFKIKTSNDVGLRIYNTPCVIDKDEWWNIDL